MFSPSVIIDLNTDTDPERFDPSEFFFPPQFLQFISCLDVQLCLHQLGLLHLFVLWFVVDHAIKVTLRLDYRLIVSTRM